MATNREKKCDTIFHFDLVSSQIAGVEIKLEWVIFMPCASESHFLLYSIDPNSFDSLHVAKATYRSQVNE